MTPELKRRLDTAAERGGRSQSQEAEFRLERSFERGPLLAEVLTLSYGERFAGFLMLVARTMSMAAKTQLPKDLPFSARYDWTTDPPTLCAALEAATALIDILYVPPKRRTSSHDLIMRWVTDLAHVVGSPRVEKRLLPPGRHAVREEVETIRNLLGRHLVNRLASAKPPKRRGKQTSPPRGSAAPSGESAEATSQTIADAVLSLVNATPHTPTREEITSVVLAKLKPSASQGGGT